MDFPDSNNTRILVTGGYGFIGSSFINYIMSTYSKVLMFNIDTMYYCANEAAVHIHHRQSNRYKFIKANITDKPLLQYLINDIKPTHIVHFAAQSHVDCSFTNSLQYTRDNVLGTHTLMDCLLEYNRSCQSSISNSVMKTNNSIESGNNGIVKIIHVSTDEVYGDSMLTMEENGKHEQSILCPTNPYAATKAGAELIASSYYHSFRLPIIITRANNVYGPDQHPEKLIPKFINLLKQGLPVTIAGSGKQQRTFIHTDDICSAFKHILQHGVIGEIYNIGSDAEYSVMEVAKMLIDIMYDSHCKNRLYQHFISYIPDRPYNDQRYLIHDDKIRLLGWQPTTKFIDGIRNLVQSTNIHVLNDKSWCSKQYVNLDSVIVDIPTLSESWNDPDDLD